MSAYLFTAGGTGGHMFPAAAVARELESQGHTVHFITDRRGAVYLPDDIKRSCYNLSHLGNRSWLTLPISAWQLLVLSLATFMYFLLQRPDKVIGFGGYVTYPVLLCARLFRVPYYIHEQNAVMGRVNRWFARGAKRVMTSFPHTLLAQEDVRCTGLPVRKDLLLIRDLEYDPPTRMLRILVLGGSQGASIFSTIVPQAVAMLPVNLQKKLMIVQQCREEDHAAVQAEYERLGVAARLATFFENMPYEYTLAHLVITRSGASTMAELQIAGRPGIFVPFPAAQDDHQTSNTTDSVARGGGWLIPQPEFSPGRLANMLDMFFEQPEKLAEAAHAMKSLGKCQATEDIAHIITAA